MDELKDTVTWAANTGVPVIIALAVIHLLYKHFPDYLRNSATSYAKIAESSSAQTKILERMERRTKRIDIALQYASRAAEKYFKTLPSPPMDVILHIQKMRSHDYDDAKPSNGTLQEETL